MHPILEDATAWRTKHDASMMEIARIEARELAAMTNKEGVEKMLSLHAIGEVESRKSSGLVEMQAMLQRGRNS